VTSDSLWPGPEPTVSVCIPAYNASRFIAASIESVLKQSYAAFELVVVDDASTDDTVGIVQSFADPRVRLIRNERNLGLAGNWNRAAAAARGRYVKVLCQDDLLYPDCLAAQVGVLDDFVNASVSVVCAHRDIIHETGRVIIRDRGLRADGRVPAAAALRRVVRYGTNPLGEPAAVMFRADAFARTGGFDANYAYMIDLDLWTRLLLHGDLFVISRPLAAFRISRGALSTRLAASQARETRQFFRRLRERSPGGVISRADLFIGNTKATALAHARRLLYAAYLRK
jgi:glycosyltransferase involved in cell wall biosynthesis